MFHLERKGAGEAQGRPWWLRGRRERRELHCADNPPWPRVEKSRCLGSQEHGFVVDSVNTVSPNRDTLYVAFHMR